MEKKRKPLRNWHSNKGNRVNTYKEYTPEFTESQAEKIFNRDLNAIVVGCIVVLLLAIVGVV